MTVRQKAAQGVFWSAAGSWGYQLASLAIFSILSRLLSPSAFGLVALASVFVAFTKILAEQGLADAIVQRPELDREHLDTAFWASVALGALLSGILALAASPIAGAAGAAELGPVLGWLSITLVLSGLSSVQRAILTRRLAFSSLAVRSLVSVVVGGVAGIIAAVSGLGVWSLVVQNVTAEVVTVVTLWTVSDWRPRWRFSPRHLRGLFGFGLNVVGFRTLLFFNRRTDDLLIGSFLGPTALGFYAVAYRLLTVLINVTTFVVNSVAFPVFARMQDQREVVARAYEKAIGLVALVAFPAFLGVLATAQELTESFFGEKWLPSAPVMQLLALAGLVQSVIYVSGMLMKALGRPGLYLAVTALTTAVNVLAFAVVVRWGIQAVAASFAVVNLVLAPVSLTVVRRLLGVGPARFLAVIARPFAGSLLMLAGVLGVKSIIPGLPLPLRVVLLIMSGMAVYSVAVLLLARPLVRDAYELARLGVPSRRPSTEVTSQEGLAGNTDR